MRKYNIQNYIRYTEDLKESLKNLPITETIMKNILEKN